MALPYTYDEGVKMGRFVKLDDGEVFYIHKGRGFPVVMTHQYGGNSWWFSRVLDAISEQFSVFVMDLPGCGQSTAPPLPYGPPEYADSLKEFMDKLGIDKAHLVANKGSTVSAVHFVTERPARVAKLVLDAAPTFDRVEAKKFWKHTFLGLFLDKDEQPRSYYDWSGKSPGESGTAYPGLDEDDRKAAIERAATDIQLHGKWWIASMKEVLKYGGVLHRLPLLQAPTLIIDGARSWSMKAELGFGSAQRLVNGIVGAQAAVMPDAGPRSAFEQPKLYSDIVIRFLEGLDIETGLSQ